jgi:hypothetical protein
MNKGLLLAPSVLGMAVSVAGAVRPLVANPQAGGRLLSPGDMRATRGGTNGGTCTYAICNRQDGPLCYPLYPGSVHSYYDPGLDCSGGPGSCVAYGGIWCEIDKYYTDQSCNVFSWSTTSYPDRCS